MERKLIERIEREMPTWRNDFNVREWMRSCKIYTSAHHWLGSENPDILKVEKREQYKSLFLEFARKPLGFYTYRKEGPTDNFGESDSWSYEGTMFELEEFKCDNNPYSGCLSKLERIPESKAYCPDSCKEKKKGIFVTRMNEEWKRDQLIQFCLKNYALLDNEEKEDLQDNLRIIQEWKNLSLDKTKYNGRYDYEILFPGMSCYSHTALSNKFPRVAKVMEERQNKHG